MPRSRRIGLSLLPLVVAAGVLAAAARAAAPTAVTGSATKVTKVSASLSGTVNPKGEETSYSFQYGPGADYGSQTAAVSAGAGTTHAHVTADIAGLQPGTTYHFRVVATNAAGTTPGQDKTFTTRREPVAFHLRSSAKVVVFGSPVLLIGQLTGPGPGTQLELEQRPFPFTGAFTAFGPPEASGATGAFTFRVPSMSASAEFRTSTTGSPPASSRGVRVFVTPLITTRLSTTRPRRGERVTFSGTVRPARDGAPFAVQKRTGRGWVTVAGGVTRHAPGGVSSYSKAVRVRRPGQYRVFVRIANGGLISGEGRVKAIRVRRG